MKKLSFIVILFITIFVVLFFHTISLRYRDSEELKSTFYDRNIPFSWWSYQERSWKTIELNNKDGFFDIFYIPILDNYIDTIKLEIAEYDGSGKDIEFSYWWLDNTNAKDWWAIWLYTEESLYGFKEYRYPNLHQSKFISLNDDKTVSINLKNYDIEYISVSWWWSPEKIYNFSWKIIWIYILFNHPLNRRIKFNVINN